MNIEIVKKNQCTGCFACASVCPKNCINLSVDSEGFSVPKINTDQCIDCGKCVKICPAHNDVELLKPIEVYAATGKKQSEVIRSSSGGAFFLFAKHFIQREHGYVCGAILDENLELKHCITDRMDDVIKMQGSKYIQSDIKDCIPEIIDLCKNGKKVLFCGTPCQVIAIKQVLKNRADNLYTLDLICHGTPSARKFSQYIKRTYGKEYYNDFSFRQRNKYVLTTFSYFWKDAEKRVFAYEDPFFQAFLDGYNYRESCYSCKYAKSTRIGDITIGDCSNGREYKSLTGKPISTIAVNSLKGKEMWDDIKDVIEFVEANYEREVRMNKQLHESVRRISLRDDFYIDLQKLSIDELKMKYCHIQTFKDKLKQFLVWHIPANTRYKIIKLIRR